MAKLKSVQDQRHLLLLLFRGSELYTRHCCSCLPNVLHSTFRPRLLPSAKPKGLLSYYTILERPTLRDWGKLFPDQFHFHSTFHSKAFFWSSDHKVESTYEILSPPRSLTAREEFYA